jgi:hypothetical protein
VRKLDRIVRVGLCGTALVTSACGSVGSGHSATAPPAEQTIPPARATSEPSTDAAPGAGGGDGAWTATGSLAVARAQQTTTLLVDGRVLIAGGLSLSPEPGGGQTSSAELFDLATRSSTPTGSMTTPRVGHTATLLPSGQVLVVGGTEGNPDTGDLASAELFDPATGSWIRTGELIEPHGGGHTATLLEDGTVLIVGGHGQSDGPASSELFDPATGEWRRTGRMSRDRSYHTATLLADGTVLVAGGLITVADAELYDPRTGSWTETGSMLHARHDFAATLLVDGTVLVAGGETTPDLAERYDPSTGSWTETGTLRGGHGFFTLMRLADGKVLASGMAPGPARMYDPGSAAWSPAGSNDPTGQGNTATLLPDGTVLAIGGDTAYLFRP